MCFGDLAEGTKHRDQVALEFPFTAFCAQRRPGRVILLFIDKQPKHLPTKTNAVVS